MTSTGKLSQHRLIPIRYNIGSFLYRLIPYFHTTVNRLLLVLLLRLILILVLLSHYSIPDEDPYTQDQLTPEVLPLSPTSPPPPGLFSSEHSPHPARRLLAVNSSNPNLTTDESLLPPPPTHTSSSSNFDRTSTGRRSLRVSTPRYGQIYNKCFLYIKLLPKQQKICYFKTSCKTMSSTILSLVKSPFLPPNLAILYSLLPLSSLLLSLLSRSPCYVLFNYHKTTLTVPPDLSAN